MTIVLVTGMSATGKSAALAELARRGYMTVDTDYGGYTEEVPDGDGFGHLWREERIDELLATHDEGALFISGTVENQAKFYPRFDAVVLLSAPVDVVLERLATRESNDFGKSAAERARILRDIEEFEPLLRAGASAEIDTRAPLEDVAEALERIAGCRR